MRLIGHQDRGADRHDARHSGVLLDRGWRYDAEVWFFDTFVMRGQIRRLRRKVLDLAGVGTGSRLLDVGCGTGTLAIEAARLAGPTGLVAGIDPAPRQIERAWAKQRRAGCDIDFRVGVIQALPFEDQHFDAVTSTLMMHHLPGELISEGLAEAHRVLRPNGLLVVADFDGPNEDHSPGHDTPDGAQGAGLPTLITQAGFTIVSTDHVPFARPHRGWNGATITLASRE